jgi:NAD(P)-dependent dehydrogenase (short-subunit alcohol dehydrogenase family)
MSAIKKIAIVTGGSRGIGYATASLFVDKGWQVITCSREGEIKQGDRDENWIAHIEADLTNAASVNNFIKMVNKHINGKSIGALINNAGVSPKADNQERLGCLNGDIDAWRNVFELNFYAPLKLSRGFAAALHKGPGAIVNVTSLAGHKVHPFAGSAYSSSKAALSALTREMANEFAALNVRVNAVAPGEISTSMIQPEYEMLIPRIPLNRMGTPEDVARTIYYLCSADAEYITGTEVWLTGGQHMS